MNTVSQLILGIVLLMVAYFCVGSKYLAESRARVTDVIDPAVPTQSPSPRIGLSSTMIGHYDLYIKQGEGAPNADIGLFSQVMKQELQQRFGNVQIRSAGETAQQPNLGTIVVTMDRWVESRYFSERCAQLEELVIPVYIEISMNVVSRPRSTELDGFHRLNSDILDLTSEDPLTCEEARLLQLRLLISDILRGLPL